MKSFITISNAIFAVFAFCLVAWCCGHEDIDVAPMEKTEKEALYSAVQGFVGNWWNGSGLYPDPCGWTPIQVLFYFFEEPQVSIDLSISCHYIYL